MRHFVGFVLLAAVLAPGGLPLLLDAADAQALRCAIACGHSAGEGARCCPINAGGQVWKACGWDESVPLRAFTTNRGIVSTSFRLVPPGASLRLDATRAPRPLPAFTVLPDHVPLSLS